MQVTAEELRQICSQAGEEEIAAFVHGAAELGRTGVNTPLRLAHFIAQCAAETGGLTIVRENTGWTAQQMCLLWPHRFKTKLDPRILACRGDPEALAELAYGGRRDLGNVDEGDGWAYRGGGMLQITGRSAYHAAGNAIGVDLEGSPDLIEDSVISLNVALWYWSTRGCNQFADRNYGRAIGNAINRGNPYSRHEPIGHKARAQWFDRAWAVLGDGKLPADQLALGAHGPMVTRLQNRLRELGYGVGEVDAAFGPTLARAIAAFKLDASRQGRETEAAEVVGPLTWTALEAAEPVKVSPERAGATARDLVAKGSTEAAAGQQGMAAGRALTALGAAKGAQEAGVLETANATLAQVGLLKITAVPAMEAVGWALQHAFWVAAIIGGAWYWAKGHQIVMARLKAHQAGWNLFR